MNTRWIVAAVAAVLAGCGGHPAQHAAAAHGAPHFTYAGADGPEHWAELDSAWAACGSGHAQSPVDLTHATAGHGGTIELHDQPAPLHLVNNGHTVQDDVAPGSYMLVGGTRFDVVQFHFHAPSEHQVDGRAFPAELHVVHRDSTGALAVLGVLLAEGAANPAYQVLLDSLPPTAGPAHALTASVNIEDLLPGAHSSWRYDGSLTTPPCTEGVHWLVLKTPVTLSAAQLAELTHAVHANNRPVQALNGRAISEQF